VTYQALTKALQISVVLRNTGENRVVKVWLPGAYSQPENLLAASSIPSWKVVSPEQGVNPVVLIVREWLFGPPTRPKQHLRTHM
jgi:hypothetical protein